MDKLIVKNFGPIKDISIDVNDINIFIGPTSSGKSTIAKLIAIFTAPFFIQYCSFDSFKSLLHEYNIGFSIAGDTEIKYTSNDCFWHIQKQQLLFDNPIQKFIDEIIIFDGLSKLSYNLWADGWYVKLASDVAAKKKIDTSLHTRDEFKGILDNYIKGNYIESKQDISLYSPIYIPAERMLISSIGQSLFGLMKNDVSIADSLKDFGSKFEIARVNLKSLDIPFLHAKYEYSENNNYITLLDSGKIKLEEASSGFQSVVPLMLVMEHFSHSKRLMDNCFVIEEPELNLYPSMQKSLVEFIVSKVSQSNDRLIITTHSPYTLTTIDNLIQAKNTFEKHPELKTEISSAVPENLWIDFNRVACYYFEDGYCRSTLDNENQSIGPSNIDDVSEDLGKTFDRLLELKYKD